jgi:hypothetical protein
MIKELKQEGCVMAVLFYGAGEHPAGFIGYRVATTLGDDSSYTQGYYSLIDYGATTAERLAYAHNDRLREQAEQNKRLAMLNHRPAPNYVAGNFRAAILSSREKLTSGYVKYTTPVFIVGSGKQQIRFPIGRKYTYQQAFDLALNAYAQLYNLTDDEIELVASHQPPASVFTEYLYPKALKNEMPVSLSDLLDRLNLSKS